jgi:ABC-type multidrug transport system ATPase subunit
MLTGLIGTDRLFVDPRTANNATHHTPENDASIYGYLVSSEMDKIRHSLGVCPQHDVLFDRLTVFEHIVFFAQLKGSSRVDAEAEARHLTELFHLEKRLHHCGNELSGGQKRKLSVAIAICGNSKFVVLDEPTAGMDPLARRELWDLLASLRESRTMLLTTHYMDEADILGDRVGIMSHGKMLCLGTTPFLKRTFGAGYQVIFDRDSSPLLRQSSYAQNLLTYVKQQIPEAKRIITEEEEAMLQLFDNKNEKNSSSSNQINVENMSFPPLIFSLPFHTVAKFGSLFTQLEDDRENLGIVGDFGVNITSLEDVFLKVGAAYSTEEDAGNEEKKEGIPNPQQQMLVQGIGSGNYSFNFTSQVIGLTWRKLNYAINDFITIPLLLLPIATGIAAAVLYEKQIISKLSQINDLVVAGMYIGAYLGIPGLIAEFLVRERADKLRNVLTVMGCDFRAYWLGSFIADYLILCIPTVSFYIMWAAADMSDFLEGKHGLCFFLLLLFNAHLIAFSYFFSFVFSAPKSCISLMPIIVIILMITPMIALLIMIEISITVGTHISQGLIAGIQLWGIMLTTPHGALFCALLDTTQDYSQYISQFPNVGATIAFMMVETALYLVYAYHSDAQTVASILRETHDPMFHPQVLEQLDSDVLEERNRTTGIVQSFADAQMNMSPIIATAEGQVNSATASAPTAAAAVVASDIESASTIKLPPLLVDRLRKVFPPKHATQDPVTAVEDVMFNVQKGEIFGLLGANGAGKTTTLSMLTRHLIPTCGDAFISGFSILSDFSK